MTERPHVLPANMPPRLLSRDQAAEYCGVSGVHFSETIGKDVPPIEIGRRLVWDVRALDRYLDVRSGLAEPTLRPIEEYIDRLGVKTRKR
jgi:hypothetical protein